MLIKIERFSYSKDETEGVMILPNGRRFATIERPWVPNPNGAKGGQPNVSCIPDGMYRLLPHESRSKGSVFIIFNPLLGVFKFPQDHEPGEGRNVCYIHSANWAWQLEGCIAPGLTRMPLKPTGQVVMPAVASSGAAMSILRSVIGGRPHLLSITNNTGASDNV